MATFYSYTEDNVIVPDDRNEYVESATDSYEYPSVNKDLFDEREVHISFILSLIKSIISMSPLTLYIDASTRESDETLFGRTYVDPLEVDPGFITEERDYDIVVWNADLTKVNSITSITVIDQYGTELDYPALPKDIPRGYDEVLTLTVLLAGPPTQDTTYTIIAGGFTYEVSVSGLRAIALEVDPNWSSRIKIDYAWLTSLALNARYFKEQRRPLTEKPWRNVKAEFHAHGLRGMKFLNSLVYGVNKVFVVPIFSEQLICSTIAAGELLITPSTDYSKFYNLQNNCTHLIFMDRESGATEIKEIDEVLATTITFASSISGTFNARTTDIYPAVFSTIREVSANTESSEFTAVNIGFEEFKKSG